MTKRLSSRTRCVFSRTRTRRKKVRILQLGHCLKEGGTCRQIDNGAVRAEQDCQMKVCSVVGGAHVKAAT